jgi:hypothetical protein
MSDFGHNLVPTSTTGGSEPTSTGSGGIGSFFSNVVETIASEIGDELNDIADDISDKLSEELGISQWYSLHLMTACEGNFAPNATAPGAWYNVTNCTDARAGFQFNLSGVLDHELSVGPLDLNLADLKLPDAIQEAVDYLNKFLLGIFVITCIGAGFAGLAFLVCIAEVSMSFRPSSSASASSGRGRALIQVILSGLSALALMIAAAMITGVAEKGKSEINDKGGDVGISAHAGTKLMIVSWVAFAVMFVALLYWVGILFMGRRQGGIRGARRDRHRGWFSSRTRPAKSPQMKEHSFESAR